MRTKKVKFTHDIIELAVLMNHWWFADGSGKTKDQWLEWLKQEAK